MSGHPAVASSAPAGRLVTLSGWGGRPRSTARVVRPAGIEGIEQLPSSEPIVPRGLGRSYGDAAQLAGGTVLDLTGMADIDLDVAGGRVTTGGGASLAEVIDTVLPHGWFLPVTPGTRHVTVGGAVAADIHGKNHHRDGSFGDHLESLRILTGDGREVVARPGDPDFRATLGGMGLTGVIVEASFRLVDVASSWMRVDTYRADDLGGVMDRLQEADRRYRYSVAWLDLAPGRRGRGVIMGGDHATPDELPARSRRRPLHRKAGPALPAPRLPAGGRLVGSSVGVFNALWYRKSREGTARPTRIDEFFYPLDRLDEWHRLYGGGGFLQYQFVVPNGAEGTLLEVSETLTRQPTPVSLAVLKRMGSAGAGLLSFPMAGWTLSADMPLGDPGLGPVLDACDALVAEAGGRVYLAKDSRTRPELMDAMYPHLEEWKESKARMDPGGRLRSDLAIRLGLVA